MDSAVPEEAEKKDKSHKIKLDYNDIYIAAYPIKAAGHNAMQDA